jgi:hypothetical protein
MRHKFSDKKGVRRVGFRRIPRRSPLSTLILIAILMNVGGCASTSSVKPGDDPMTGPAGAFFLVYDKGLNHLAAVRRGTCPMYPSCSAYSREAFQKHGFVVGWWMTYDRLLRCGRDELKLSPRTLVHGRWKVYDPVSHNDWWWYKKPPHRRRRPHHDVP